MTTTRLAAISPLIPRMRAVMRRRYGTPEVLTLEEIDQPTPGPDQVLVRVHAAAATIGDHHMVTGKPYVIRLSPFGGIGRPKFAGLGNAMSGRVEAIGANVTLFQIGDEVYGDAIAGAYADYVVVDAARIAAKPRNLSFEDAAASPWAVNALQALRDAGRLQPGQRVMINGASGGVGTWAIQIAKAMGAHVTAVCSTRNIDMVRSIGADEVIDYTKEDFVDGGARFDLVLDTVTNRPLSAYRSVLVPDGTYVSCGGGQSSWRWLFRLARLSIISKFSRQRLVCFIVSPNREDLVRVTEIIEAGKARPVIESRYKLEKVVDAVRHVGEGHARGQTIVQIAA